jgi:hypothetical protein
MKRLERAGFDVARDTGVYREPGIEQPGMRLRLARGAVNIFLYPDSANRGIEESGLDRSSFLTPEQESTASGRTLLTSMNLLAIMEVPNARSRDRIADALLGGPPQPAERVSAPDTSRPPR